MVIHAQAIKQLSSADYHLIEEEHSRLNRLLTDLLDTCCNLDNQEGCECCDRGKLASCQGRLPSFLSDAIDLAGKHFYHEESIMLSRPNVTEDYEYFRVHRQAHAVIMHKLHVLVNECFSLNNLGNTVESYREFFTVLSELLEEHDCSFDDPFIQSTKV